MWCAAKFGIGFSSWVEPCQIEIAEIDEQREYDFHLSIGSSSLPFQIVEIIDHDRKRNDEYKRYSISEMGDIFRQVPMKSPQYAGNRISKQLEKKIERYKNVSDLHVLAYLNCNIARATWAELHIACAAQAKKFASVWVVTDSVLLCLWGGSHWHGLVTWHQIEAQ
jgi:hypothetical protein